LAFKSQPVLLKTFLDKGTPNSAVVGLALLANLLYVVYKKPLYVFVFDTNDQRRVSINFKSCGITAAAAAAAAAAADDDDDDDDVSPCKQRT